MPSVYDRHSSDSATALSVSFRQASKSASNAKTRRDWPTLSHICGSTARVRVLIVLLLTDPDERVWLRQIGRAASVGFAGLYRELGHFERVGMIRRRRDGGALYFEVDESHPLVRPLRALLLATKLADEMLPPQRFEAPHEPFSAYAPGRSKLR